MPPDLATATKPCPTCGGSGIEPMIDDGKERTRHNWDDTQPSVDSDCPDCDGTGCLTDGRAS